MLSPSLSRITNRMRSSITELSFHGIHFPPPSRGKSVTHVSGTFCYLCVEPHIKLHERFQPPFRRHTLHPYGAITRNQSRIPCWTLTRFDTERLGPFRDV